LGFEVNASDDGRPKYHPRDLLKIFIYGYLNKVRSCKDLEKTKIHSGFITFRLSRTINDHNKIIRFAKIAT
jgi:transposase